MKFFCDKCSTSFQLTRENWGTDNVCPGCGNSFSLPENGIAPGVIIGDFKIENAINSGGMGDVYQAKQVSLDRPVALKVLQTKHSDDKEYIDGLYREARAAAKISHPNVVQAYAVGEDEGIFFFAMELVRGNTFKEILKEKGGKLDFTQASSVIRDVARALSAAWKEQKLVHQDIKPDNIMLDANGFAKLADLGLAKNATSVQNIEDDSNEVLGTPQYISPEQLTGVPTDVRSDIYSLGATFYQFVTGRYAYVADSLDDLPRLHVEGNLEPPKSVNPELPDALNDIIVKMMARQPEQRYQNPDELIKDIEKFLSGTTAPATPQKSPFPLRMTPGTAPAGGVPSLKLGKTAATPAKPAQRPAMGLKLPGSTGGAATAKPIALPGKVKPAVAAAPAAPTPVAPAKPAAPATPTPVAPAKPAAPATPTPVAPAKPAAPAAPTPVAPARPAAPATPTPVAVKPAASSDAPAVKKPKNEAKDKTAPGDAAEKVKKPIGKVIGTIVQYIMMSIGIIVVLAITFVVNLYLLQKYDRVPKFLKPVEKFFQKNADAAKTKAIELSKPAEQPVVIDNTPKTRPEYIKRIDDIIRRCRSSADSTLILRLVDEAYAELSAYQTSEELAKFEILLTLFHRADENQRCYAPREQMRLNYRDEIDAKRQAIQRAAEERRIAEENRLRQEMELQRQSAEAARRNQELLREQKAHSVKLANDCKNEAMKIARVMIESVLSEDQAAFADAKLDAENLIAMAISHTPEDRKVISEFQAFVKDLEKERNVLLNFKRRISNISKRHGIYVPQPNGSALLLESIRPGEIVCRVNSKRVKTFAFKDLAPKNRIGLGKTLSARFKQLPNAMFYLSVLEKAVDKTAHSDMPENSFWSKYWMFFDPVLKK